MSRFFLNSPESLVPEAVEGFLCSSRSPVAKLDLGPGVNVVVRPDWNPIKAKGQVALVSGGGSGHEPMHAGFVGAGMLTAAVCGGLFASPSIDAVLSTILHVSGDAGVIVIVKAYTGDCLNFGLAVEKARSMGIRCEMIVFSDDIAIPDHARPRGLAGTVLMHKILGYLAEKRKSLAELKTTAEQIIANIATIGLSITSCSLPNGTGDDRIPAGHAELGLGIHGEPGASQLDTHDIGKVLAVMTEKLAAKVPGPVAAFLNNLGGVSELEMNVICASLLKIENLGIQILVGPASMCTSLDMKGFSITFLGLEKHSVFEEALMMPVSVHGWCNASPVHEAICVPAMNQRKRTERFMPTRNETAEKILKAVCERLIASESELNELDKAVGDGDCGSTFAVGCRSLMEGTSILPFASPDQLFLTISEILGRAMGGSSGVLLAIAAVETGTCLRDGKTLKEALESGVGKMMELGGAKPGMRTMIDALVPAIAALDDGYAAAAKAAQEGAESTKGMATAGAGRSSYLNSDALVGHCDPGAQAVAFAFAALADLN